MKDKENTLSKLFNFNKSNFDLITKKPDIDLVINEQNDYEVATPINDSQSEIITYYKCQPKNKAELQRIINDRINNYGPECDLNDIDTSKVTDMSYLFDGHYEFNGDISLWDVSNVMSMRYMFNECIKFNCDLSQWDVSSVRDMAYMFWNCEEFNQDLNEWDVSNVKNMCAMFYKCFHFNGNISAWDVSNVEDMTRMFNDCYRFDCDLSKWDVSNVIKMGGMFSSCEKFLQDLNGWDVSNVVNWESAFYHCPTKPLWLHDEYIRNINHENTIARKQTKIQNFKVKRIHDVALKKQRLAINKQNAAQHIVKEPKKYINTELENIEKTEKIETLIWTLIITLAIAFFVVFTVKHKECLDGLDGCGECEEVVYENEHYPINE